MFKLISQNSQFDFLRKRLIAISISAFLIVVSIISFATQGLNYGIDFSSGYIIQLGFEEDIKIEKIKDNLLQNNVDDAIVQYYGSNDEVIIKLQESASYNQNNINSIIKKSFNDTPFKIQKLDFVGSQVGQELRDKGEWAMLVALLSILVYIGFRFEFIYGIGAILALIHDVIITLGLFSLFRLGFDLSVLSAILAVIGYSLNDTIVVYDRIRENSSEMFGREPIEILNKSINQTLSRTIITSVTTLFVLISLLVFGGPAVSLFSIAMIIGIIIGTYSSIYIAGTSLYFLNVLEKTEEDDANQSY